MDHAAGVIIDDSIVARQNDCIAQNSTATTASRLASLRVPIKPDLAIRSGARAIWMQLGLTDEVSAARARDSGLRVVMDSCIMVEHRRHFGGQPD